MKTRLIGVLFGAAMAALPGAARAQTTVVVKQVIRVVKSAKGASTQLNDVRAGESLAAGDRVRTAGRSAAGLRFPDQSTLRLGELTEVVLTSPKRRDLRVLRGNVLADYRGPGIISGGYAVAAVRGTHIQYTVDEAAKTASVRCYKGRVFVAGADNPLYAGVADSVTPTSLVDPGLVGAETDWKDGEVRFTDGPNVGVIRQISGSNTETGTITFQPALPARAASGARAAEPNGFLLVKKRGRSIVELRDNMGTVVGIGAEPQAAKKVPSEKFAGLSPKPVFQTLSEGSPTTTIYNGTDFHQEVQQATSATRQAVDISTGGLPNSGICDPAIFGARIPRFGGLFGIRPRLSLQTPESAGQAGLPGTTPESRALPQNLTPFAAEISEKVMWRFEPFAVTSNRTDVLGARVRVQASSGDAYVELGYRYALIDGQSAHDVSEGFIILRGKYGDFTLGRQHLFLRLANNTNVGTLLGLESTDALVWQAPLKKGFHQTAGYIFNTSPLHISGTGPIPTGFHAGFLRGQAPIGRGNVGYSLMVPAEGSRQTGWSLDAAQSIIPNKLDIYGEGGVDTQNHNIYTAGIYIPALYQLAKTDFFIEYHNRRQVDERLTFRVRREFARNLLLLGFLDRQPGDVYTLGGAILWSLKFR